MAAEKGIWINHKFIGYRELRETSDFSGYDPYYRSSLEFCQSWLNGIDPVEVPSSGSTGIPKSIMLSREQLSASIKGTAEALELSPDYHALVSINTNYIGGKMMLLRGMELQMDLTLITPSSLPLKDIDTHFDFYSFVPFQLHSLLKRGYVKKINSARVVIIGGGVLSDELETQTGKLTVPCYHTFGMTETASHFALRKLNSDRRSNHFKVLPGIRLGTNDQGQLRVFGKITGEQWLTTNDLVEIVDPEHFIWKGRIDDMVNSGGIKLFLPELEKKVNALFKQKKIDLKFFLGSLPDVSLGEKLILVVESEIPIEGLAAYLNDSMEKYLSPKEVYFLPSFPLTETGKIRKKEAIRLLSVL